METYFTQTLGQIQHFPNPCQEETWDAPFWEM